MELMPEHLALHSLFHHFVGGVTLAKNIIYTTKTTLFKCGSQEEIQKHNYWDIESLASLDQNPYTLEDFTDFFKGLVQEYLSFINPSKK